MNYSNIYIKLCQRAKHRIHNPLIHEKHHALPKFMFGNNDLIISLTLREHYIAHLVLVKAIEKRYGKEHSLYLSALRSVFVMSVNGKGKTNSRIYESFRIDYVNAMRGKSWGLPDEEKRRIMTRDNPMHKPGVAQKVSNTIKQQWQDGKYDNAFTEKRREKIRLSKLGANNPMFGNSKASAHLNVSDQKCVHCGIVTTKGNITRWHNNKCKNK